MSDAPSPTTGPIDIAEKIARLVEERGWNQSEFARIANLNLQTARQILAPNGERKLRNATIGACARALNLSVNELRSAPLERLLPRMRQPRSSTDGDPELRRLYEQATQPELLGWAERNPERARDLGKDGIDELLSMQGTGGPLTQVGVEHYVAAIERKRALIDKVSAIAGTEYLELLEGFVNVLYDKVQPYSDRR